MESYGAVILCGGESSRMGRDKAWLPWDPQATLLQHVVETLEHVVPRSHIAVVGGCEQRLPPLASAVTIVREEGPGVGPLAALVTGFDALPGHVAWAFACGCDAPLLRRDFVAGLFELAKPAWTAIVPAERDRLHPLAAVYHRDCLAPLRAAVDAGERSLHRALRRPGITLREVSGKELSALDADGESLVACNTPEEYEAAMRKFAEG